MSRRLHPSIDKQPRSIALRAACIAILVFLANHAKGQNVSVAYSFLGNDAGGVAQVEIEPRSGKIVKQRFLFKSRECEKPAKVRRSLDNRYLALTNLQKKGPHLFLFTLPLAKAKPESFSLPSIPDELRFAKGQLLVSCEEDALGVVSLTTKPSLRLIRFDDILTPLGNGPQDIHVVPDSDLVVISCQKDGKTGRKFGNRLVLLQLPKLDVVADLPLPRDHPELHFVDNNKESGPGPEIVYVSAASDTLVATLDLYGGVGMMKWSAAREGRIENWSETSTSLTQSWGTAFPDRASALRFGNREYFLVHNAGSEGGSSVVDLQNRKVIWQRPTPPGMEQSVYFPSLRQAFSVCSGKVKERSDDAVEKMLQPQTSLYVFDFRSQQAVKEAPIGTIPLDSYTARIYGASNTPPLLLIAVGASPDRSDTLITFDPVSRTIKDSQAALGRVSQVER